MFSFETIFTKGSEKVFQVLTFVKGVGGGGQKIRLMPHFVFLADILFVKKKFALSLDISYFRRIY